MVTDGVTYHLLADPDPVAVEAALPAERPARWRSLDASVLHLLLLERLWQVSDDDRRVDYLHDSGSAVRAARRAHGVAVLMRPVAVSDVLALAARGRADAAEVDLVRPEAAHRAGAADPGRLTTDH